MKTLLRWEGRFTPADKAASDYVLLPFDMPPASPASRSATRSRARASRRART
jgi:hypothetical protein